MNLTWMLKKVAPSFSCVSFCPNMACRALPQPPPPFPLPGTHAHRHSPTRSHSHMPSHIHRGKN